MNKDKLREFALRGLGSGLESQSRLDRLTAALVYVGDSVNDQQVVIQETINGKFTGDERESLTQMLDKLDHVVRSAPGMSPSEIQETVYEVVHELRALLFIDKLDSRKV